MDQARAVREHIEFNTKIFIQKFPYGINGINNRQTRGKSPYIDLIMGGGGGDLKTSSLTLCLSFCHVSLEAQLSRLAVLLIPSFYHVYSHKYS